MDVPDPVEAARRAEARRRALWLALTLVCTLGGFVALVAGLWVAVGAGWAVAVGGAVAMGVGLTVLPT